MSTAARADLAGPSPLLLHVVPRLPPAPEGVGNYAVALARGLAAGAGIDHRFLVAHAEEGGAGLLEKAIRIPELRARALVRLLAESSPAEVKEPLAVLVHYSNYGYADRGCPRWLVKGLLAWRRRSRASLICFFHEVYARGAPWQSSFWLSPVQRRLAAALARGSDRVLTNLDVYRDLLARWVPAREISVLPVFSTVGELASPSPLAARRRRLVVFGGAGTRARAYGELAEDLAAACAALGATEIADVGPVPEAAPAEIAGVPVERMGALPASAVSALLAGSLAGFVSHRPEFFGKSTVLAAYCAHGMLPVAIPSRSTSYFTWAPGAASGEDSLQAIADAAAAWYAGHSLARQVDAFRSLLGAAA